MKHPLLFALAIATIGFLAVAEGQTSPEERLEQLRQQFPEEVAMGIPVKLEVNMPNPDGIQPKTITPLVFTSQLVSPAQDFAYVGECHLLIKFNLDSPVAKNLWQSTCDDKMKGLWLNGRQVVREQWSATWKTMDSFQIPSDYFVVGENTMAITYENTGNAGGLAMDLQLLLDNGRYMVVTADQAVGLVGQAPKGWQQPGFDCSGWAPVAKRPGPPATPWTAFSDTAKYTSILPRNDVTITLLKREKLTADVRFSCRKGFHGGEKFTARLTHGNGFVMGEIKGTASELKGTVNEDGSIDIHFSIYGGEYYGSRVKMKWKFGVENSGSASGDTDETFYTDDNPTPGTPLVSKIVQTERGPIPTVNGSPYFFNILTLHADKLSIDTGMEGEGSPFNTIALRIGTDETAWWLGPDQYDFYSLDRCLNTVFQRYPESKLALYVWCQPPSKWYISTYPERLSRFEEKIDGKDYYQYYVAPVSFSNADALEDAKNAIRVLVEHIEKYFGSRVLLYNLQGGVSCEWQGWAAQSNTYADFSDVAIADFKSYAKKYGIDTNVIPGRTARETGSKVDSAFHLPNENALEILYDKYYSETISHYIDTLAEVVKDTCTVDKLVGAYYGYHMEHANMVHSVNGGGHNNLQALLDSPNLDFFLSPQSYGIRSYGAPNAEMKPYGAIRKAGKLSFLEDDTRTHLTEKTDYEQTPNLEMTLNILKRNVGMSLSRNVPLNHFPIKFFNQYNHPAIREMFKKSIKVGQYLMEHGSDPSAEIAAVIDEEAVRYIAVRRMSKKLEEHDRFQYNENGELKTSERDVYPISGDLLYYQRIPLSQIGAPVDMIMLSDVVKHGKDYKVVIFLNSFKDTPALREAIQYLRENNITTVFTYGTGFIDDQSISVTTLSECVGMTMKSAGAGNLRIKFNNGTVAGMNYGTTTRFKVVDANAVTLAQYNDKSGVAVAKKGNAYFYGTTDLDHDFLQDVARDAGVFFYSDTKDNVFASKDIVSIHTAGGGHKTIHLPKVADVVEIYSGKVVARQTDTFEFDMAPFETRVFLYGNLEEIQQAIK